MLLLAEPGCDVRMMGANDWRYLVSLCDPYVMPLLDAAEKATPEERLHIAGPEGIARK